MDTKPRHLSATLRAGQPLRGLVWMMAGVTLAAAYRTGEHGTGVLFIFSGVIAGVVAHGLESAALYFERKGMLLSVKYGRFILAANPALILLSALHGRLVPTHASARVTTLLVLGPVLILSLSLRKHLKERQARPAKPRFLSITKTEEES